MDTDSTCAEVPSWC